MFKNDDGRNEAGVIGILIAHLGAFGSGELKMLVRIANSDDPDQILKKQSDLDLPCLSRPL